MKRFLLVIMMITTIKAFGIFGFGVHAGVDNTSVDKFSAPFDFSIAGNAYSYEITRDEVSNPFVFGGQIYLDVPLAPIGFEANFEASWASYRWTAPDLITDESGAGNHIPLEFIGYDAGASGYSEEFTFGRFSTDLTAKWYVFSFPPVVSIFSFYVGGGAGFHFITPLVSKDLIIAELQKETSIPTSTEVDIEELVKSNVSIGYHIVTGARIKFPVLPLAFNIDYKWTWADENDYGDPTNNFGMIKGSASIYF